MNKKAKKARGCLFRIKRTQLNGIGLPMTPLGPAARFSKSFVEPETTPSLLRRRRTFLPRLPADAPPLP
jgi:hypothetical protein